VLRVGVLGGSLRVPLSLQEPCWLELLLVEAASSVQAETNKCKQAIIAFGPFLDKTRLL
jgi:hypothetical protein